MGQFWFGTDGPNTLQIDSQKVVIKLDDTISIQTQENLLLSVERIVTLLDDEHVLDNFIVCSLATSDGYIAFLNTLDTINGIYLVEPYYLDENGIPNLVGERFCVGFKEYVSINDIEKLANSYYVVIDREIMTNVFVFKNTDSSNYRILDLTNTFYALTTTKYAHPSFKAKIERNNYRLFDYYHDYQLHTKKVVGDFNNASVWDFAGLDRQITVAIIDDGVDEHEDLPAERILEGYDFADKDSITIPSPYQAHGMACVGIISASHTTDSVEGLYFSSGMISINPNVIVLHVKIFCNNPGNPYECQVSNEDIANAITFAYENGADILSNSWNYKYYYQVDIPVINDALERATLFGRNERGFPVIFSAGNWGIEFLSYPARLPYCFSVGATDLNDNRWDYSSYGGNIWNFGDTLLDIVAPSGYNGLWDPEDTATGNVWTLDQMDTLGMNRVPSLARDTAPQWNCGEFFNNINYNCMAGGTSMACPIVSGIASLLLSKDSTLSFQEVYDIMHYSAVTELESGTIIPPDYEYGYGRVDAFRAILSISRGDVENDNQIDIADPVYFVHWMFGNPPGPAPFPSPLLADCDCDGDIDIADLDYLVDYMFGIPNGPPPVKPCFEYGT